MIRKVLVGICAFSLIYSCSKEDDGLPTVDPVVENNGIVTAFVPKVAKQDWAASDSTDTDRPNTRAWDTKWSKNEHIGFYMIKASDGFALASALEKNKEYLVDNTYAVNPASSADLMYYPVNNNPVQFVAYCPYDATAVTNNHTVTYDFSDQDAIDGTEKEAVDFIFHKDETPYQKDPLTDVVLDFHHKFSKIRIRILQGASEISCEGLTSATLTKMPTSATVDLVKLAMNQAEPITVSTPGTITAHIITPLSATEAVIEAIIPPHKGTGTSFTDRTFKFEIGGEDYEYSLDNTFEFVSGEACQFDLTIELGAPLNKHDGLSNCYLIAPNSNKNIPITRAFTVGRMPASTADDAYTLEKLWDDSGVISSFSLLPGTGETREFEVTTNDEVGNAVIALRMDGQIYWSWHIWVTDPDDIQTWQNPSSPNNIFMDRNLGATEATFSIASHGLMYQFGRKDPFPGLYEGSAGYNQLTEFKGMPGAGSPNPEMVRNTTANVINCRKGILESIRKPCTYFNRVNTVAHHWLPDNVYTLWKTSTDLKTVYDPCPDGWRVPYSSKNNTSEIGGPGSPWYGMDTFTPYVYGAGNGISWGTNANFPYVKMRYLSGADQNNNDFFCMWNVSKTGDSWVYRWMTTGTVNAQLNPRYRATFVRCIQEI
jgi:hypothetical protein